VNRNLVVGLVVVVLLGALGYWLANNTHWEDVAMPGRPKGEAVSNPFYAVQHLSESLGAKTEVRREIARMPSSEGVIVLDMWDWDMIPERRQRIEQWVNNGGRLVANLAQLNYPSFQQWSGVRTLPEPKNTLRTRRARSADPKTRICGSNQVLLTAADNSGEQFDVYGFSRPGLTSERQDTWRLRDADGQAQVLRIPVGRGSVTLLDQFNVSSQAVPCGDYALLYVAATQLRRGDSITFLTEGNGGSLLGLIWRYGAPAVTLGLVWIALWLWRSGVRFGPLVAPTESARRSLAEQIRGTGQFTLRFGGGAALYAASVRALDEAANRHILHYERLTAGERVNALERVTRLSAADLARALEDADARSRTEIRKTIAFLEAARRRLVAATQSPR
jgi:hypothetical protein